MKNTMKKFLALFLAMVMLVSVTACNGKDDDKKTEETAAGKNADDGKVEGNVEEVLNAAVKKTKEAKTLHLKMESISEAGGEIEDSITISGDISNEEKKFVLTEKDIDSADNANGKYYYFADNKAYYARITSLLNEYEMYASDDSIFEYALSEFAISNMISNKDFIKDLCALSTEMKKSDNGDTIISIKGLDYIGAVALAFGKEEVEATDTSFLDEFEKTECAFELAIDKDGYFKSLSFVISVYMDNAVAMKSTLSVAVSNINGTVDIKEPEFVSTEFDPGRNNFRIYDVVDGRKYEYSVRFNGEVTFEGVYAAYYDKFTVPVYTVKNEIEGYTVNLMDGYHGFTDDAYIESIVIPKGISHSKTVYGDGYSAENTSLFFEDEKPSESSEDLGYVLIGEDNPNNYIVYKAAYYAGEWELIDGIPTPKA